MKTARQSYPIVIERNQASSEWFDLNRVHPFSDAERAAWSKFQALDLAVRRFLAVIQWKP